MNNILVTLSRDEDIPAISGIYAHHVRTGLGSFETDPPSPTEMSQRYIKLRSRDFPFLVARQNDRVVGYAYAGPYRERRAYRFTVEDSIYVDPTFVGRGVGKMLLDALIRECESRDFRQMIAVIGDSGNLPSIKLHERCGFRSVGVFRSVGFKHDRWVDVVLMQRSIGDADETSPQE